MHTKCLTAILTIAVSLLLKAQHGQEWKYFGPGQTKEQVKGMFKSVWTDENDPNFVLAGSATGGLFKTENAMSDNPVWSNITDSYGEMAFGIGDIVVKSGTNRQVMFVASGHQNTLPKGYGNGILQTTNGGKTWERVGPHADAGGYDDEMMFYVVGLIANKENEDEMLAYTARELYFTRDSWRTYEKISLPIDKKDTKLGICDVEFAPFEPGKFYVATSTYNTFGSKLFICDNYGASVKDATPADVKSERIEIATVHDKKYTGKFYVALGAAGCFVQYFNGTAFSGNLNERPVTHSFGGAYFNLEFAVNQLDTNVMYLSMTETSRSVNGGHAFVKISSYNGHNTHADNRGMILGKSSVGGKKDLLLLANDGGISLASQWDPVSWKSLNGTGLDANQFWGVSVLQSDTDFVAGGAQDNGGFLMTSKTTVNTMNTCGDGYLAAVLDPNSAIIECNAPAMYYYNIKNGRSSYVQLPEGHCDAKRPLSVIDSFVYMGYGNIWRTTKRELALGLNQFKQITVLPQYTYSFGGIKNHIVKGMAIGRLNSAAVSFQNPNWGDPENNGKLFFCPDLTKGEWKDVTADAVCDGLAVCEWTEVTSIEMDARSPNKFYILARDVYDQTICHLYALEYIPDSARCIIKQIGKALPRIGINQIKTDRFSNVMYLACDNGVYYADMNVDTVIWNRLNSRESNFPRAMVFNLDFNYATNTLYAVTFGRGIWRRSLVATSHGNRSVTKNTTENEPVKVDGVLIINRKITYTINSKMLLSKGSKVELKKGATLIIRDKMLIRNERNERVDLKDFIVQSKGAKLIIEQ